MAYFVDAPLVARRVQLSRVLATSDDARIDAHMIGPPQLLRLAQLVYDVQPEAYLLHVPGVNFGFNDELSPPAAHGVEAAFTLLNRRVSASLN